MERAFGGALIALSTVVVLAGAIAPAGASDSNVTVVQRALPTTLPRSDPLPSVTAGFGLVTTSESPPKFADYTILNLFTLSTPWQIAHVTPQAQAPMRAVPPITHRKLRSDLIAQKQPEKLTWLKADWWRGLTWLRIH
jgi:hypothetical protein